MEKAIINIEVELCNDEIKINENMDGPVHLILEGLTCAIRHLESGAPADAKMQFRAIVLKMLNEKE